MNLLLTLLAAVLLQQPAQIPEPGPDGVVKLPSVSIDTRVKEVRVQGVIIDTQNPLEFICVTRNGPDHETIVRTEARPSHVHAGLMMLGLEPGRPVRYNAQADVWLPPQGPAIDIYIQWRDAQNGLQQKPITDLIRSLDGNSTHPRTHFVFAGSKTDGNQYLADAAGYVVSLVNFELSPIDVPALESSANELLAWRYDNQIGPAHGTDVTLILRPSVNVVDRPEQPNPDVVRAMIVTIDQAGNMTLNHKPVTDIKQLVDDAVKLRDTGAKQVRVVAHEQADAAKVVGVMQSLAQAGLEPKQMTAEQARVETGDVNMPNQDLDALRARWREQVAPKADTVRDAASTHRQIIIELREKQQKLIDEIEQIQRVIDELESEYNDMSNPGRQ